MSVKFYKVDEKGTNPENPNTKILSIKITNQCNLTCPYCYTDARKKIYDNEITLEDIKSMIDIIKPANAIEFTGGECLTKYDLVVQAKDYALTKTNRLRIATNGTVPINIKDFYPLPKGKSIAFMTSIDGFKEDHEKNRGKGTFEQVLDFSRELISYGFPMGVTSIVPDYYYDNDGYLLHKFHNFLINFGFKLHVNTRVSQFGRGKNFEEDMELKLKCLELCEKHKTLGRVCMNCGKTFYNSYQKHKVTNMISVDNYGFVRPYCQLLEYPLFHYSEYSNEKYIQEIISIMEKYPKFGYWDGVLTLPKRGIEINGNRF